MVNGKSRVIHLVDENVLKSMLRLTSHCTEAAYSDLLISVARFGGSVNSAVGQL